MQPRLVSRARRYQDLAQAFRPPPAGAPQDLVLAYTRLFVGPGKPLAPIFESVYIDGQLFGESAARVAECYAEANLQVSPSQGEMPDHISLELAFMGYLVAEEHGNPDQADLWRQRQHYFLNQHLGRWLPNFCERILQGHVHPVYDTAAQAARGLLSEELSRLESLQPSTSNGVDGQVHSSSRSRDALSRSAGRSKRFANMQITVDRSQCTLCTLCVDQCRAGALTLERAPSTLSLFFDQAQCNGCQACRRLCPEKVITLVRGPALSEPSTAPRRTLLTVARVICPQCQQPHIAQTWLERLAERLGDGPAVRRSLALCPFCKTTPADEHSTPVRTSHGLDNDV